MSRRGWGGTASYSLLRWLGTCIDLIAGMAADLKSYRFWALTALEGSKFQVLIVRGKKE